MNRYIIVLSLKDNRVERIIESPPVNNDNVWDISATLSASWLGSATEFPASKYEVILGAWDSIAAVQGTIGRHWNWKSASRESLSAKA